MATLGHVAVGLAAGRFYTSEESSRRPRVTAMALLSLLSIGPDLDVIAFILGIPYDAAWGHRGAVHSLGFAVLVGLAGALVAKLLGWPGLRTGIFVTAVVASHGLLDIFTDGGLGIALLWPFSNQRFFAPWQPIPVAPIGLHFFSKRGLFILITEAVYFSPLFLLAFWPRRGARV